MKTLAQFKKDIERGDNIIMTSFNDLQGNDIQKDTMKKMRTVSYKDTTGFYLAGVDDTGRGSFCGYPKASELTYDGDTFTIKDSFGERVYQIVR